MSLNSSSLIMKQRTGQSSLRRTKLNSEILEKVHFDEDKSSTGLLHLKERQLYRKVSEGY